MSLTAAQHRAVRARGNVLVMAGAGSGKTSTLVGRSLDILLTEQPPPMISDLLVVTFTEAAAAEMRQRLRARLEEVQARHPGETRWAEQLALFDTAHIGTIHSFCYHLIGQYFHQLELDPQLNVLTDAEARLLAEETLDPLLEKHFDRASAEGEALQQFLQVYAGGHDRTLRNLVLKVHRYARSLPHPDAWLRQQTDAFENPSPQRWQAWLPEAFTLWHELWTESLARAAGRGNELARQCLTLLGGPPVASDPRALEHPPGDSRIFREGIAVLLRQVLEIGDHPPRGKKGGWVDPLKHFWADARFLASLAGTSSVDGGQHERADASSPAPPAGLTSGAAAASNPLADDWRWSREHMRALLRLTCAFSDAFAAAKRERGELDFADLEQHALRLLWDFKRNGPTPIAEEQRRRLRFVFVDEYQDINAAQDLIITALSREGEAANRFLVGDMKQSIYRFRLADPRIFRQYAAAWREGGAGQMISLSENFRSREGILDFVNVVFRSLMRPEVGGLSYDDEAALRFGAPEERRAPDETPGPPCVELHLLVKRKSSGAAAEDNADDGTSELQDAEKEARLVALRLRRLVQERREIWDAERKELRPVRFGDMAVLLRAPRAKAEGYARQFESLGVPLQVSRGGFFNSIEIADMLNLLRLLDNPLQDLPTLAVLRSPLVGLTLDELATLRLALPKGHFWSALARGHETNGPSPGPQARNLQAKVATFLTRYQHWRRLARQGSLSRCLDTVLAETHYPAWLLTQPRGPQRHANIERLLTLAQRFDQFQRQGLFRFLRFIEAQQEAEAEPEVAQTTEANAVRLMSIHQSKGLEFPVVVLADLGKRFNDQDLRADLILDEDYGLCPCIQPPGSGRKYPSLAHWLARQRQQRELLGEELRLLYVAMTRARDLLLLAGSVPERRLQDEAGDLGVTEILAGRSYLDWLWPWVAMNGGLASEAPASGQNPRFGWQLHTAECLHEDGTAGAGASAFQGGDATPSPSTRAEIPPNGAEAVWTRLEKLAAWRYAHLAATREPAKTSVTGLRRRFAEAEEATDALPTILKRPAAGTTFPRRQGQLSAADTGTAHHIFLQFVSLARTRTPAELRAEAQRLEKEGRLSAAQAAALDFEALAGCWNSVVGGRIRGQAEFVRRELGFTARFSPEELRRVIGTAPAPELAEEQVVVQGVADLVVLRPDEIWLLDFKTDAIAPDALPERVRSYEPQLRLYALALARIYRRPVTEIWLHFLALRRTEALVL